MNSIERLEALIEKGKNSKRRMYGFEHYRNAMVYAKYFGQDGLTTAEQMGFLNLYLLSICKYYLRTKGMSVSIFDESLERHWGKVTRLYPNLNTEQNNNTVSWLISYPTIAGEVAEFNTIVENTEAIVNVLMTLIFDEEEIPVITDEEIEELSISYAETYLQKIRKYKTEKAKTFIENTPIDKVINAMMSNYIGCIWRQYLQDSNYCYVSESRFSVVFGEGGAS